MSPIVYRNLLIYPHDRDLFRNTYNKTMPIADPSRLFALDKRTGKTVWETPRDGGFRACYSVPFVLGHGAGKAPELIVTSTTAITSYEPETGNVNWNWVWPFRGYPLRTISGTLHAKGVLLSCAGEGADSRLMVALALNGMGKEAPPEKLWESKKDFPYVASPVLHGDHIYFVNESGMAACFSTKTGIKMWFERIPDAKFLASPLLIDDKIYACSEQGDVYVIAADPTSYQLLAKNSLAEPIYATPAVADGRLYVRTKTRLYCIGVPNLGSR
jgi:outer membrane protein assembly factor BamB